VAYHFLSRPDMGCSPGKIGKAPEKLEESRGGLKVQQFVSRCALPATGLICTTLRGDDEEDEEKAAVGLCSYILYSCTTKDATCNLKAAEGLQVTFHGVLIFPPDDDTKQRFKDDAPQMNMSAKLSWRSADSTEGQKSSSLHGGHLVDQMILNKIKDVEQDPDKYVLHVDIASVMSYQGFEDKLKSLPDTAATTKAGSSWTLSWNLKASHGYSKSSAFSWARSHSGFKTESSIGSSGPYDVVKVTCQSLEVDQLADAMCASWLPVGDVLEGIQTDLCEKMACVK